MVLLVIHKEYDAGLKNMANTTHVNATPGRSKWYKFTIQMQRLKVGERRKDHAYIGKKICDMLRLPLEERQR